jgi:hypothetical protein
MATRKVKPAVAGQKATAAIESPRPVSARAASAPQRGASPAQIIREAAWSRMFGRAETKNPFAR